MTRLPFYKKIRDNKPSNILCEQNLRETLEDIAPRLSLDENGTEPLQHCFQIDGTPVSSLVELNPECRVLVVSTRPEFVGLQGLDKFFRRANEGRKRPKVKLDDVRPKPATWVHTATVSWLNKNDTADVANNFMEGS